MRKSTGQPGKRLGLGFAMFDIAQNLQLLVFHLNEQVSGLSRLFPSTSKIRTTLLHIPKIELTLQAIANLKL